MFQRKTIKKNVEFISSLESLRDSVNVDIALRLIWKTRTTFQNQSTAIEFLFIRHSYVQI